MHVGKDICLLKRFLFSSIHRLFHLAFSEIYMEKNVTRTFLGAFFGCMYHSNGTKIHLDAALSTNFYSHNFVSRHCDKGK